MRRGAPHREAPPQPSLPRRDTWAKSPHAMTHSLVAEKGVACYEKFVAQAEARLSAGASLSRPR
jgi:hypothetical protein